VTHARRVVGVRSCLERKWRCCCHRKRLLVKLLLGFHVASRLLLTHQRAVLLRLQLTQWGTAPSWLRLTHLLPSAPHLLALPVPPFPIPCLLIPPLSLPSPHPHPYPSPLHPTPPHPSPLTMSPTWPLHRGKKFTSFDELFSSDYIKIN
jgi:hypothetical protein